MVETVGYFDYKIYAFEYMHAITATIYSAWLLNFINFVVLIN